MIWTPDNFQEVRKLALRRKPVTIKCDCGSWNTICLPAGVGQLKWRCDNCTNDLVIDFGEVKCLFRKEGVTKGVIEG